MTAEHSKSLALDIIQWALAKKGEEIVMLELSEISDVTDYFLVISGGSQIQVRAITDAILEGAIESSRKPLHVEGRDSGRWVLIDFVDVVAHVMLPEARDYYSLERLWGDAAVTRFGEDGEPVASDLGAKEQG